MLIGINGSEEKAWSTAPLSADLSLIGEYGGKNYGLPSDVFVPCGFDLNGHLPEGSYAIVNLSGSELELSDRTRVAPWSTEQWTRPPWGLTIKGPSAHLCSVYMPGAKIPNSRDTFTLNPLYEAATRPYAGYRFTPQLVNGNGSDDWFDENPADYTSPSRAADVINSMPWIDTFYVCLPHGWSLATCIEHVNVLRVSLLPHVRRVFIERSNELWNESFGQFDWLVNSQWGRDYAGSNRWHTAYRASGAFQAELAREIKALGDPRLVTVLASQNGNEWVASEGLSAAREYLDDEPSDCFDWMMVAPYASGSEPTDEAWYAACDEAVRKLKKNRAVADDWGLALGCYELNSHFVNPAKKSQIIAWHREDEMETRLGYLLSAVGAVLDRKSIAFMYRLASIPGVNDFGIRDDILPGSDSPRHRAVMAYIEANPAQTADLNRDGVVDNGDNQEFIKWFLSRDMRADLNADGVLDNGDIAYWVERFKKETQQ